MSGKAVIQQGTAKINNFLLQSPRLNVIGTGSVNVITQAIDMMLHALPTPNNKTNLSVHVTGTLNNPHYLINTKEVDSNYRRQPKHSESHVQVKQK
jgi:uncharacterized protein YhdP